MGLNRRWKIILGLIFLLLIAFIVWSYQSFVLTRKVTKSSKEMQEAADAFFDNHFPTDTLNQ